MCTNQGHVALQNIDDLEQFVQPGIVPKIPDA